MILATANIKNYPDMTKKQVTDDAKEVAARSDIWGMQENNPVEDDEVISRVLGDDWGKVGGGINIPIWFRRKKIECIGFRVVLIPFDPVLPLTPRPRTISIGRFALKGRSGVPPFTLINNHLIAGGKNGPEIPSHIRQWEIEWDKTKSVFIKEHAKSGGSCKVKEVGSGTMELNSDHDAQWVDLSISAGDPKGKRTVFFEGDFNNPRPPKPGRSFTWLAGGRLDRIGVST